MAGRHGAAEPLDVRAAGTELAAGRSRPHATGTKAEKPAVSVPCFVGDGLPGSPAGSDEADSTPARAGRLRQKRLTDASERAEDSGRRLLLRMDSCPTELAGNSGAHTGALGKLRRSSLVNVGHMINQQLQGGGMAPWLGSPASKGQPMLRRLASRRTSLFEPTPARHLRRTTSAAATQPYYPLSPSLSVSWRHGNDTPQSNLTPIRATSHAALPRMTPPNSSNRPLQRAYTISDAQQQAIARLRTEHPKEQHMRFLEEAADEETGSLFKSLPAGGMLGQACSLSCASLPASTMQGLSPSNSVVEDRFESVFRSARSQMYFSNYEYEMEGAIVMSPAKARWMGAANTMLRSHYLAANAAVMANKSAPGADRFYAVVNLEWMLFDNTSKRKIVSVLTNLAKGQKPSVAEMLQVELTMTGERILRWFTPAEMDHHHPYFSLVYIVLTLSTFFFMAGEYGIYTAALGQRADPTAPLPHGPQILLDWMRVPSDLALNFDYLREWGSRYAPAIAAGEWYRWYSSVVIHASFVHMLSNLLLTVAMSLHLENKYGAWRIALLWVISCGGGQLISAAGEDVCGQFVGSSGGVFGMMGLFIADMIFNFETISRPLLRCLLILLFIVFFVITIVQDINASHLSHIGGLICGLFPAFLFLPKLRDSRRWEWMFPALGSFVILAVFVALPVYLYSFKFAGLCCVVGEDGSHRDRPGGDCLGPA
eukprot:jgi/Tetstr1/422811/TSEL_013602.t1